jgi:murein DD-endopeptidase MepM/ murein hydrolase activator NlpD
MGEVAMCIPSILPLPEDTKNFRWSGGFGYRKDPVYGDIRMHEGIDFTGAPNSPVYATGDGRVEAIKYEYNGYGRYIILDHGFGYKTRYAHLNQALVYEGQVVKRGERIGLLGSTGKSTGYHLHYEVIYMGRPVNPYNYLLYMLLFLRLIFVLLHVGNFFEQIVGLGLIAHILFSACINIGMVIGILPAVGYHCH